MDVGGEESWEGREQAEQGVDGNGGGWEGRSGACDMAETSHVKCHAGVVASGHSPASPDSSPDSSRDHSVDLCL